MYFEQLIKETASAVVSFTDSYVQNKQGIQKEQSESESTPSITDFVTNLHQLNGQIGYCQLYKQVIQFPKILQSLVALSLYKVGSHIDLDVDRYRMQVRSISRRCLGEIRCKGDEQDQTELVNIGYGRVISLSFSTAGGVCEEQDKEISNGLWEISMILIPLHEEENYPQSSFRQLPLLARRTEEQIEKEGAYEEIDAQMNNNGNDGHIKMCSNYAKAATLNRFIHQN
ncbi:MAG: hypothetical protein EZS28_039049 [Streblomastix strix]|uniref:Uncharacterized protein n=1 Tax=Streblomastix strix TaxID=222440 RepID=A0A5J4U522_9EUKA|nr:MAG: hypothetical protein EZS28_039049 [Streblomastix strix]